MLGQEVVACGEEMHRSRREEWRDGGDSFCHGAFYFLALAGESKATTNSECLVCVFKMDSERHSAAGNACVQLLDELRLWLTSVGSRGTTKKTPPLHLTSTS